MSPDQKNRLMTKSAMKRAIEKLAFELAETFPGEELNNLILTGIQLRGVFLAQRLCKQLKEITGNEPKLAKIDTSMYRDDIGMRKTLPVIHETEISSDVNDSNIVLVDDVLWRGRTIRAALDAITDFGRPKTIRVAVLIERKGREFPIYAEFVGMKYSVPDNKRVYVNLEECDNEDAVLVKSI